MHSVDGMVTISLPHWIEFVVFSIASKLVLCTDTY